MRHNDVSTRRLGAETQGVCALVQDMLPFYMEDDVSAQSRMFIDEHLEACDRCASFLAGGRSVQEHLRRDSSLRATVVEHDTSAQDVVLRGRRQLMGVTLIGAGIAAMVVLGVLLGFNGRGLRSSAPASFAAPAAESVLEPGAFSGVATPVPVSVPGGLEPTVVPPAMVPAVSLPDAVQPTIVPPAVAPVAPISPPEGQ